MDEHLQAAGRSITLRRTVTRWLEYAVAVWTLALVVLYLSRWSSVSLTALVVMLVLLGCSFAAIAFFHNARFIDSARRERSLARPDGSTGQA